MSSEPTFRTKRVDYRRQYHLPLPSTGTLSSRNMGSYIHKTVVFWLIISVLSEWAGCQRVGISPDTHRVPYHISFGSRIPGTSGRQRATSDAPPADFQDFLSRIFQVPPGQMSNGNFFAAPQPGPGATAASKPNSTVPKGKAKPKRRKKVRRPFQR